MMVGRSLEEIFPRWSCPRGAPVLTAANVTTERLPHPVNLALYEGEILGLGRDGWPQVEPKWRGRCSARTRSAPAKSYLKIHCFNRAVRERAVEAGLALVPEDRKTQGLFLEQSIAATLRYRA